MRKLHGLRWDYAGIHPNISQHNSVPPPHDNVCLARSPQSSDKTPTHMVDCRKMGCVWKTKEKLGPPQHQSRPQLSCWGEELEGVFAGSKLTGRRLGGDTGESRGQDTHRMGVFGTWGKENKAVSQGRQRPHEGQGKGLGSGCPGQFPQDGTSCMCVYVCVMGKLWEPPAPWYSFA